jgi:AbiV family abortive infection protein
MTNETSLTPDVLLLGSLYALEQCGLLLTDASALIEQSRYPTGAAVALLAREELGRSRILLELWRTSVGGTPITRQQVGDKCQDHVRKQQRAQLSLTYRTQRGDQLDTILRERLHSPAGSPEREAAQEKLRLLDERRAKRQPHERHGKRMAALYVDLMPDGTWSRPCELDPPDCAAEVEDALNDYVSARQRFDEPIAFYDDVLLADALAALPHRPVFPPKPELSLAAMWPPSKASS